MLHEGGEVPLSVAALMACHSLALVEHFHGARRKADVHLVPCELIGHAVVVVIDLYVVVNVYLSLSPLRKLVASSRQRLQSGLVCGFEQRCAAAVELLKRLMA